MNQFDKDRAEANQKLLTIMEIAIQTNPTMRFGQILESHGFVNVASQADGHIIWYREAMLEPTDLLDRVRGQVIDRMTTNNPKGDSDD